MVDRTARPPETAEQAHEPPDIATMRDTVNRVLDPDAVPNTLPPSLDELQTFAKTLHGHIAVLAPEVEEAARDRLKPGGVPKYTVLQCAWEARSRLEAEPSSRTGGPVAHVRRLARSLNALCDHYERLTHGSETPQQTALRLLGEHSATCDICRARDDQGVNANLPCAEADRLFDAYQQACRVPAASIHL
jgi:hypothetical protein